MSENNVAAVAVPATEQSYIARTSGLKNKDYIGYALGDTACCLVFGLITSLLQKYYTDILFLNPIFIMIMMVGARIWDAINDPIMGRICDRMKPSKHGRYRPWLLYSSIPLALITILVFAKFPGMGEEGNYVGTAVYATITYIAFGMAYTMLQIPYGSLASVVTTDEKERSKLSVFRSVGAGVGGLPVLLIAAFCYADKVGADGNKIINPITGRVVQEMQYMPVLIGVIVLSLFSMVILLLAFKFNKERVITAPVAQRDKGEFKKILKNLLKNRAFLSMSVAGMLLLAGQMFTQSYNLYLFDYFFGRNWMNVVCTIANAAPMVLLMLFTPKLVRKFGKKEICAYGMILAAASSLIMFALRGVILEVWWLFIILSFTNGLGTTFMILQVWSLTTDAIDDIEVKTGRRDDGTAYAIFMFFRKLGQVIAAVAVNGALLGMGYGAKAGELFLPTSGQLTTMYDMATIIPAVFFALMAIILLLWYPLSKKKVAELQILKEAKLKEAYESNTIGIDGESARVFGDVGVSDVPEMPYEPSEGVTGGNDNDDQLNG